MHSEEVPYFLNVPRCSQVYPAMHAAHACALLRASHARHYRQPVCSFYAPWLWLTGECNKPSTHSLLFPRMKTSCSAAAPCGQPATLERLLMETNRKIAP